MFNLLLLINLSMGAQFKVAVVDTGYDVVKNPNQIKLCKSGHKDFTRNGIEDALGHGTNISGIIDDIAKKTNYCQYIIKYNAIVYEEALEYAINLKPDLINLSLSGTVSLEKEKKLIKKALDENIIIVASIGNEKWDLDVIGCIVFPACIDKRIIVVGNLSSDGYKISNKGKMVDVWPKAERVTAGGKTLGGSSQGAAMVSGRVVKLLTARKPDSVDMQVVGSAFLKQTGLDDKFYKFFKKYDDKYLNKEIRIAVSLLHWTLNSINDKQLMVTYKWNM